MRPRSIDRKAEKRAAVRSVVVSTLLQLMMVAALLWLRTMSPPDWLSGLLLLLAVADLITIPFTFTALWQRVREIEKGELEEAKKY
ncbi:MAG: hypothetical protein HFF45_06565 [Lawsonibacter sp.]|jgi:protein-S-isoprenylcysteine O-methyltransferase Ste14|nr:hypothetical protein [Lawsonibacter sp.]MCI9026759.1 hypothetical protein [Lawsonibacter sp.]MCI9655671.1 hypothetical protein [Lawsonibacter sp.]